MRATLLCLAVAFACLAGSIRADDAAAAEAIVPVAVVADDAAGVAAVEAAISADVPLVRSKRGILLLKKLALAKLGLVGLGLGAAKIAAVGGLVGSLKGGLGGGGGHQQQQYHPQPQPSYGGGGHKVSGQATYVVEYVPKQQSGGQW